MPIPLTAHYDAACLRAAARGSKDANQTRWLLTLAAIYDGATRTQAAAIGGVCIQSVACALAAAVRTARLSLRSTLSQDFGFGQDRGPHICPPGPR